MKKKRNLFTLTGMTLLCAISLMGTNPFMGHMHAVHAAENTFREAKNSKDVDSFKNIDSFEDFDACEDDPQAYREYEKQQKNAGSKADGNMTSLSGYTHNSRFDSYDVIKGIDVSVYQSDINWKKVKKDGIDFAFIRVAYRGYGSGTIVNDLKYEENITHAIAAGVDVGVYIFSQATTVAEAIEEARHTVSLVKDYDIHLPIVMDFEYASTSTGLGGRLYQAKLSKSEATEICNAFCQTAEAMGYTGIVYANRSMLESQVYASQISNQYDIWLANYVSETGYKGTYSYWQYTSTGSVKGITGNVDRNYRYIKKPATPSNLTVTNSTYTSHTLSWDKVPGVYGYEIYRSDDMGATFTRTASVRGAGSTSYTDQTVRPGTTSQYKVRAYYNLYDKNLCSSYTQPVYAASPVLAENTLITSQVKEAEVALCWADTAGTAGYELYRSTDGVEYTLLTTLPAGTNDYIDQTLNPGTLYYYQLAAGGYVEDGTIAYAQPEARASLIVTTPCLPPQNAYVTSYSKSSISLSWDVCPQATTYYISQYEALTNSYRQLAAVPANMTNYTVKGLSANTEYEFQVTCSIENASGSVKSLAGTDINGVTQAKAPTGFQVSACDTETIKLSWKKSNEVSGYQIFRYDPDTDSYKQIKTITDPNKTSYTNKNLSKATGYSYQIRSYRQIGGQKYYGVMSDTLYGATAPAKVKSLKATAKKSSIKLSWKKSAGATGYIIYRYDTKSKKYKKLKTVKTTSYTHKNLKKNTTFKYKVVPYKSYKGETYKGKAASLTAKTKK